MPKHSYGYIKDEPDERDYTFRAPQKIEQLPPEVDLRNFCSPVRDQGNLGSCTGFSMATGLREFLELKYTPPNPPEPEPPTCLTKLLPRKVMRQLIRLGFAELSPLFLYYEERVLEGTVNYDAGAYMRDGMKVLKSLGVCLELRWPYIISKFRDKPDEASYQSALLFLISNYTRIMTLNDLKASLALGNGAAIGFNVYSSFETDEVANTGKMPMPKPGERLLGGHAVFVVGYKDDLTWAGGGYLIVKNSWSSKWGDSGFFYMPYAYAEDSYEVSDIWTGAV